MIDFPDWVYKTYDDKDSQAPKSGELSDAERALAYSLVSIEKGLAEHGQKSLFDMTVLLLESGKSGSTCLAYDAQKWLDDAPKIVGSPGIRRPIIYEAGRIFTERNYRLEQDLAENILARFSERNCREELPLPLGEGRGEGLKVKQVGQKNTIPNNVSNEEHSHAGREENKVAKTNDLQAQKKSLSQRESGQEFPQQNPCSEKQLLAFEEVKQKPTVAESGAKLILSEPQWQAIRCAVNYPLSIISGGPGTGKTSIIVTLLRILVRIGIDPKQIVLAAPTGKAASRMNESIQTQLGRVRDMSPEDSKLREQLSDAQTIHRILKYSLRTRRFQRDAQVQIRTQFLIVDEASMIDLGLMKTLFDATPLDAQIVLVGDARQLPSVEVGAVLRDLVGSKVLAPATGLLEDSYRVKAAGADILKAAADIDHGRTDAFFEKCIKTEGFIGKGISILGGDEPEIELNTFLEDWFEREFMNPQMILLRTRTFHTEKGFFSTREIETLDLIFSQFRRAKILCATRVWKTGSTSINAFLHKRLFRVSGLTSELTWLVGEPVLMTKNNYEQNLFNGEQGVVLFVKTANNDPKAMIVFSTSEGYRAFSLGAFSRQIESAFAITTHKSQGSEFDDVALILPEHISKIVSRELVYTAITRARRSVIILGSEPVLRAGITNSNSRVTRLCQKIDGI